MSSCIDTDTDKQIWFEVDIAIWRQDSQMKNAICNMLIWHNNLRPSYVRFSIYTDVEQKQVFLRIQR